MQRPDRHNVYGGSVRHPYESQGSNSVADEKSPDGVWSRKRPYEGRPAGDHQLNRTAQITNTSSEHQTSQLTHTRFRPPRAHGPPQPVPEVTSFHSNEIVDERGDGVNQSCKRTRWETGETKTNPKPIRAANIREYLPEEVCQQYSLLGKSGNLFQWQEECLACPGVLNGQSIVYCAPTSAGKSLVAEILMLRKLSGTNKSAMLVLPFVALCAEKATHLEVLLKPLHLKVRRFYGSQNSDIMFRHDTGALVCTIEKANTLVNRMIEEGSLEQLGIVVVDELHMVDDPYRGYLLELMLTKIRYVSMTRETEQYEGLQIVGMSATMPNGIEVAQWLGAELYVTQTRPVPLKQFLKVGTAVFDESGQQVRKLGLPGDWNQDPDHVAWLTKETVDNGHSVLIFCCSKRACEICAQEVSELVNIPVKDARGQRRRSGFVNELAHIVGEHQQALAELIEKGVAFHHAGLSSEERDLVERAYKCGAISVLTATSTLAAGVNLPARRVIFREPYVGISTNVLDATKYRQMAGRAGWHQRLGSPEKGSLCCLGRAGIDDEGEAYLIESRFVNLEKLQKLIRSDAQPVCSCLGQEQNGMVRLLLEVISNGAVRTGSDIERLIQSTLLAQMPGADASVSATASEALTWLSKNQLIVWHPAQGDTAGMWTDCSLSQAIVSSGMDPRECALVKKDLREAMQHLVLASDLHLTYLVTPYNIDIPMDWEKLYYMVNRLSITDTSIADLVGVNMAFLQRKYKGDKCQQSSDEERTARRFYAALILKEIISEVPLTDICTNFNLSHGLIEALQEKSLRYASMSASFCGSLGWVYLQVAISEFQKRIYGGARPEIVHLTEIPFVKAHRARLLYKAGFRNVEAIAELDSVEKLARALTPDRGVDNRQKNLNLHIAQKIVRGARTLLRNKLIFIEEETKAAAEIVSGASSSGYEETTEEPQGVDADNTDSKQGQKPEGVRNPIAQEKELTASLRRLSFDPMPFVNAEGIVVLHTEAEMRSLCRYLVTCETDNVSFQSHFSETDPCLMGIAISWSDRVVAYVSLADDVQKLRHLMELMQTAEIQKSTFELGESMNWMDQLVQESSLPVFPSLVDVHEAAKLLKRPEPAMNDLAGLFMLFELEEDFQKIKGFYAQTSQQTCSQFHVLPCCSMAALTRRLWTVLKERLDKAELLDVFLRIKMPHVQITESLSLKGFLLDRGKTSNLLSLIEDRIVLLERNCTHFAGMAFDPCCTKQVDEILFEKLRLKKPQESDLDEELRLRALQDQHFLPAAILQCQRSKQLHGCLFDALQQTDADSSVWLSGNLFHQMCQSCVEDEQAAIQSLPLHDVSIVDGTVHMTPVALVEDPKIAAIDIKDCLTLREGFGLVVVEYLHLDVWLLAHFSQDRKLMSALSHANGDVFRAVACAIHETPYHESNKISQSSVDYFQRFLTGYLYGAGPLLSAHILGVSENRAQQSYDGFSSFFRGVSEWIEEVSKNCASHSEIRTLHGQRLSVLGDNVERLAMRSIIQGSISDILKLATIQIKQLLEQFSTDECSLLFQQDHSFVLEVTESAKKTVLVLIKDALLYTAQLNVPTPVMIQIRQL